MSEIRDAHTSPEFWSGLIYLWCSPICPEYSALIILPGQKHAGIRARLMSLTKPSHLLNIYFHYVSTQLQASIHLSVPETVSVPIHTVKTDEATLAGTMWPCVHRAAYKGHRASTQLQRGMRKSKNFILGAFCPHPGSWYPTLFSRGLHGEKMGMTFKLQLPGKLLNPQGSRLYQSPNESDFGTSV